MASTNKTINYELSQYIGTDKPTYLGDYNSDMSKIDNQMKANNDLANSANSLATTANQNASQALSDVSNVSTVANRADSTSTTALEKAINNENKINNINVYSTDETVIGKWLGKNLYRKVFETGALPNNTDKLIDTGLTNITPIRLYGYAYATSNNVTITLPDVNPTGIQNCIRLYYNGNDNKIGVATASDRTAYLGYVILEYTKTADNTSI